MSTSSGGLINVFNNELFVCDLEKYTGTYILSEAGNVMDQINGLMWFANQIENNIYYSNQKDNDFLYCLNTENWAEKCVLERPCGNIVAFGADIFFLDEIKSLVYRYEPQTDKMVLFIKEKVSSFILHNGAMYYASERNLKKCCLFGGKIENLADCVPVRMTISRNQLIFADKANHFVLSCLDLVSGNLNKIEKIKTQSIVADEEYIYAANLLDNRSIVRVGILTGETIRFCGEKADKLHILQQYIYFQNQNDKNTWYKMPLAGGRSVRVIND